MILALLCYNPDTYRFHKLIICNELIGELFKDNTLDFCLKIKTIRQNLKEKIVSKTNFRYVYSNI